jgi:hypothetical protein
VPRSPTALGFLLAFVVLAAVTIAGVLATWPQQRQIAVAAVPATTALAALLALHLPERSLRRAAAAHAHAH